MGRSEDSVGFRYSQFGVYLFSNYYAWLRKWSEEEPYIRSVAEGISWCRRHTGLDFAWERSSRAKVSGLLILESVIANALLTLRMCSGVPNLLTQAM